MKYKLTLCAAVCASLVACGGGGENAPQASSAPPTPAGKVQYAAYADPAGALCTRVVTDAVLGESCVEPTSSSATPIQLQQYLLNPNGKLVHFSLPGFNNYLDSEGREYRGLSTRDAYVGGGRIKLDGLTYGSTVKTWAISLGLYSLTGGSEDKQLHLRVDASPLGLIQVDRLNLTEAQSAGSVTPSLTFDYWTTFLGQRTDWSDAPEETTLIYQGAITISGGPSGRVTLPDGSQEERWTSGECSVKATFDVRLGTVLIEVSDCMGQAGSGVTNVAVDGGRMQFSVRGSRVGAGLVPAAVSIDNADLGVAVSSMQIADVAGGIFGSQAHTLHVGGAGSQGGFEVFAVRVVDQ